MTAAGTRAQKSVGSAAWISTEKENVMQLVNQEMEEVEYPVRHEMDWLNEHMAEIFSNNQFNFAEAFKTPGKLRGKTPRTARKRDANENRLPLSEVFSSSHNRFENKFNASPAFHRSPTKSTAPPSTGPSPTKAKNATDGTSNPEYPDLSKTLNSFPKYNTDSGYHGMPDEDGEDDMILTQVQPESQPSTQPFEREPSPAEVQEPEVQEHHSSPERRTTGASFHSAQEDVRQRSKTAEPIYVDPTPKKSIKAHSPETQPTRKGPEPISNPSPVHIITSSHRAEQEPAPEPEQEKRQEEEQEPKFIQNSEPESNLEDKIADIKSSPVKIPSVQPEEPEEKHDGKNEMALDKLDEIGSPSDGSTPERPPIRKSSLSFASLPAREPLTKKSLGGSRISRTSHIDTSKLNSIGGSSYLGRQTGGHRTTQAAVDENPSQNETADVGENMATAHEDSSIDTQATKLHSKSSTQRLHEKISMLGKLQPSRPTKSIPSAPGLSSVQVSYPELPTSKPDARPEESSQKPREITASESMDVDDDWIKPLNSPYRTIAHKSLTKDPREKTSSFESRGNTDKNTVLHAHMENANDGEKLRTSAKQISEETRGKSSTPTYSSPQRLSHRKGESVSYNDAHMSTTPVGSPSYQEDGPLSASKSRLQSIVRSAKGLFTNAAGVSAAAKMEASSPSERSIQPRGHVQTDTTSDKQPQQTQSSSPRPEGRKTRSSTEREERRRQKELEDHRREEEQAEQARQQEKQRAAQLKDAKEKSWAEHEERSAPTSMSIGPSKMPQVQKQSSKEPEIGHEATSKLTSQASSQQQSLKQNDRRPLKPNRDTLQKPKPQPVSIRVGSALSRQIPLASSSVASSAAEPNAPAPAPASTSKQPSLKKKASNTSLHTASSNSSFKSSVSSQSQRKAQLASERKREQEEREARRKEEQRRELERRRAAQQQEEARRQEMRSRAEAERRERLASEDPKKAAQMQAIEKRRLENARRLERQGSQQPANEVPTTAPPSARPASRLGSIQPFGRSINQPQPNPAKPPKRGLDEEASHRPPASKTNTIQPSGETKRRRTEDEHNSVMRPTMAPPIRQSNIRKESSIRKEPTKPSIFSHVRPSTSHQSGSSIFKTAQPQRPAHPMDMAKYTTAKIPFAESSNPSSQPGPHKTPGPSQKAPPKPSPQYPNGENIHLPEIATDSEDEDSDAEMLPVPKWAQQKELEDILRRQEGMEADSIFGPIAPFSLEETFKSDKKIKKFRERTSSANWAGTDALTQEEIRRDLAERQRLRLNGGWTFGT